MKYAVILLLVVGFGLFSKWCFREEIKRNPVLSIPWCEEVEFSFIYTSKDFYIDKTRECLALRRGESDNHR